MKKTSAYPFLLQVILIAAFVLYAVLAFAQSSSGKRPNIIYIYADDLGYGDLGCYGQQKIKTPNLDRMAKEGMRFTQHYAGAPVCAPSRAILMTGKHAGHSYIRGNYELGGFEDSTEGGQMPLPEGTFTIPKMLKNAGYSTGMAGKWGLGVTGTTGGPLLHGFDYYYGLLDQKQAHNFYPTHLWENDKWDSLNNHLINVHKRLDSSKVTDADFEYYKGKDYAITKMTEKALAFIDRNLPDRQAGKQKPFFLYLPYTLPHLSLQAPDEYVKKYIGQFDEKPYYGQLGYAATKYPLSTYAAMITYLDDQVGIIMEKIKKLGLDNNTIILFSSDNGATFTGGVDTKFFNSVAGLRGLKMDVYEGGIREPFIARWPGKIKAGTISNHVSAQYDLLATLADLTGQTLPVKTDGISFLPELFGKTSRQKKHDYLYFEYPEKGGQVAIRMGDWKGVRTNVRKDRNAPWQIFNLVTDRNETTDIAARHPEIVEKFNTIQEKEHQHSHIKEWEFIDPKFSVKSINE
ncbi:arylsulfatase [Terrimonas pollutisoli]|uniref:arylsulfatase n=1 Tax=Terrimonas pollutisoli TaxID=3034147 RepID=UPI0023ED9B2C|nr:arylsulfatase [Terrimonas sp. H1YJ31]